MDLSMFFYYGMDRSITPARSSGWRRLPGPWRSIYLGGGVKELPGYETEALGHAQGWDAETMDLPFDTRSVDVIWALHFLEHIRNLLPLLSECERVLKPGGNMNICVPYGTCHMAVQDPTHVRFFNEDTWKELFFNEYYSPYGPTKFIVGTNVIMGVKGTNLALLTQLVKG